MRILEPVVHAVGQLSFRNKLRATAVVFGIPLLIAAGVLLFALNARVFELKQEQDALAVQVPALALAANLHQMLAAKLAMQEGGEQLEALERARRNSALADVKALQAAFAGREILPAKDGEKDRLLGNWDALSREVADADIAGIEKLTASLHAEMERLNENTGLLIDGEASSSRLLDIMTTHLPGLVETTGRAAQVGSVVLVKKSVRGSRRTDLTLQRGNFDALVQWSMDGLQKVSRDHPALAPNLSDAGSRLNAAFLAIQEAMTVKMLETTDFDMTPEAFIELTTKAFNETLSIGEVLAKDADVLLTERLSVLEYQRNAVVFAILLVLSLVVACFFAAYISIMRGLNGLADAVTTMAAGDLSARVEVSTRDELGAVGTQFNQMVENLARRTAELREKTNDIHSMLQNMEQGILTIVDGGRIHPEYSSYLETIYETGEISGQSAMKFIFGSASLGSDALSQVDATIAACLGEDRMNFDFNSHLLANDISMLMSDGRTKFLHLSWSPICDENDTVEKIMVCVRDVTELRQLAAEAEHQKRELEMIGQILRVNQEKFHEFIDSARRFIIDNEALLNAAEGVSAELIDQLFRNMHTIKGNARTYGLLHLTNIVHEAEQAYEALRRGDNVTFNRHALLEQLQGVLDSVEEYESLNEVKLGRKGPGRRGSAEKYVMLERAEVERMASGLGAIDLHAARPETLVALLEQVKRDLQLVGTENVSSVLGGVFESLPSLAKELGKESPKIEVHDNGIRVRNQIADLMRNVFMHLYRNSMDHGIEKPAERLAKGKAAAGTIRLDLGLSEDKLQMRLQDDGKGLALAYIRAKALEKGLIDAGSQPADDAVAGLIFAAGFSTATAVTEVSGRGVGMDAVLSFVKREGGSIGIELTDTQEGADFRSFETVITLPGKYAVMALAASPDGRATPVRAVVPGERNKRFGNVLSLPGKLVAVPN
ncbi:MAG: HAMP domain-containing protein [Betaproteobacteria bacterium]|uniref:Chemotaxis protein CheA n=1 Tax=Candidatus Proximibacter danicus TaxID=2954365 RepID=A0A9D7K2X1_9PROT|nr:HAMP domain-containing protein [Candidatus Proximibacter danicus]